MKRILFLLLIMCSSLIAVNAQNRALHIYEDGTNFFLEGLDEIIVTDLTIEGWVKLDAGSIDDYTALVDFRNAGGVDSKALIFKNAGGYPTISYEWNGNWLYVSEENFVNQEEWTHVAIVVSGADKQARFYTNGFETGIDDSYTGLGDELPLGENIRVGAGLGSEPLRTLIGTMDEIRIWTVARTEDEIALNMEQEIDPATEGLLMYYKCNEEDGAEVLIDATGNGYDIPLVAGGTGYEFVDDTEWNTGQNSVLRLNQKSTMQISPNPVHNELVLKGLESQHAVVAVYDVSGREVMNVSPISHNINVAGLQDGIYFVVAKDGKNVAHGRFVKE